MPDAGLPVRADILEEGLHRIEPALAGDGRVDDRRKRAGARRAHQRAGRNEVGEIQRGGWPSAWRCWTTGVVPMARSGSKPSTAARSVSSDARNSTWMPPPRRAQPFGIGLVPPRLRAGGADITQIGAGFGEQAADDQFGAFITRQSDARRDGGGGECAADGRQDPVQRRIDLGAADTAGLADRAKQAAVPSTPTGAEPTTGLPAASNSRTEAV